MKYEYLKSNKKLIIKGLIIFGIIGLIIVLTINKRERGAPFRFDKMDEPFYTPKGK